jgi:TP901 family phage tail tape measure protein
MEGAESSVASLSRAFMASAAATAALTGGLAILTRQHGETEQRFARLQTVAGATDAEMQKLRSTAMQIGRDLPISIRQSAGALEQLSFAGFEAEEAVSAAQGVADLATASSLNMAESARTTASALRMFGLEADETHQVTASMAATFSNSATNIRELSQALEYTGTTAQMAGISLHEVNAAVGVLADQGIRASKAGTALNTTLQRLMSGSGQAEKALSKMGLSISDLTDEQGELRDMQTVFSMMSDRMGELEGQAEKMQVATELAGQRGSRAFMNLVENSEDLNSKMGDAFRAEIQESIAALSQMSDDELANIGEQLNMEVGDDFSPQELITNLEEMHEAGMSTKEMATQLQESMNLSQGAAEYLAEGVGGGAEDLDAFAASLGGATTASKLAASQMDTTAGAVEFLRSSVSAFTYSVFSGASPAITLFNEKLAAAVNMVNENREVGAALGAVIVGLTGVLGIATVALGAHIAQLKLAAIMQGTHASQTAAGTAALWAWTAAASAKNSAITLMTMSTGQLIAATSAKTTALWGSVTALWGSVTASYASAGAMGVLSGAAGTATTAVTALWTALGPLGLLVLGITAATAGLVAVWKGDLFGAGDQAAAALDWIAGAGETAIAVLTQLAGIGYELARILVTALVGGATAAISTFTDPDMWMSAGRKVVGLITDGLAALGPARYALPILGPLLLAKDILTDPQRWIGAGEEVVHSIVKGIKNLADTPVEKVKEIAGGIRDVLPFSDAKEGPLSDLTKTGVALIDTIVGGIEKQDGAVKDTLAKVLGGTPAGDPSQLKSVLDPNMGRRRGGDASRARSPIMVTLEQTVNLNGDMMDPQEIREIVRDAARGGGEDALKELELILKQATSLSPSTSASASN